MDMFYLKRIGFFGSLFKLKERRGNLLPSSLVSEAFGFVNKRFGYEINASSTKLQEMSLKQAKGK